MPTYEYRCATGHSFEMIHKMSETPRVKCPVCGKPAVRQISGGAGLVFKGSGFYITDYGKDGKGARKPEPAEGATPAAKPESPAPAPAADKASKVETKPSKESGSASTGTPEKGRS